MFTSDPTKVIHTEMVLAQEEFDNYQIGVDTDVTFCLKELRVRSSSSYKNTTVVIIYSSDTTGVCNSVCPISKAL